MKLDSTLVATEPLQKVLVVGCESVGKSELLGRLTGRVPNSQNYGGSTVFCEVFRDDDFEWIDTPGIYREADSDSVRDTINALSTADTVVAVVRVSEADREIPQLLPLIQGKKGVLVLSFADQLPSAETGRKAVDALRERLDVPVFAWDNRKVQANEIEKLRDLLPSSLATFPPEITLPAWEFSRPTVKKKSVGQRALHHPLIALLLLFLPAGISIVSANGFADWLYGPLSEALSPLLNIINGWPPLFAATIGGSYGIVAMLPFLILYATPTILAFALLLAIYKSSGLIDIISRSLHPYLRPFGMSGRDLVRVIMGFGCNVPAITATRACGGCSRGACVSAISFGSACSYQLPATLAVFAAAGMAWLAFPYLAVLAVTTLVYMRATTPKVLRDAGNSLMLPATGAPLQMPRSSSVWREVRSTVGQFVVMALPIFLVICVVAALLEFSGVLGSLSRFLAPIMALFNLPGDAASAVVLGSIRKDGIAIALLGTDWESLKVALTSPVQVLTAVYLAGVALPCIVTLAAIGKEIHWRFALTLCAKQVSAAIIFSLAIAWGGWACERLVITI